MSVIKEGGFIFHDDPEGAIVTYRGRKLGKIVTMYEASGRHCFRLGCDTRREPRTYRGRVKAAEALKILDRLARQMKKEDWSVEELVIRSWDVKPRSVSQD